MILFNKVLSRVFYSTLQISFKNRTQSVRSLALKPSYHLCPNKTVFSAINGFVGKKGKSLVGAEYKFTQVRAMGALSPLDPSSFSRPELAVVKHISLSLSVDFDNKILSGTATLNVDVLDDISEVILDVRNLNIESIESDNGERLKYTIGEEVPTFGSKLSITLPKDVHSGEKHPTSGTHEVPQASTSTASKHDMKLSYTGFVYEPADVAASDMRDAHIQTDKCPCDCLGCSKVDTCYGVNSSGNSRDGLKLKIKYSTVPTASALQWLDPNQTSGKKHPYMFSQCQPIHARSILPCQDTPAVKFTYDAEVIAPEEFTVLMSALRGETKGNRTSFKQPMPLPSYLVAIAVGVLEFRSLGPRSKVWAEKQEIEASAWEFAETEKFLQAAEKLCGPYEWTEYDLLVLPPSFPYGGMENPCLTFVTPTLLAGDRSLADVIVHEIMHSWTGNLVTNRNFEHFWLNEGFTVFLERKVGASLITDTVEAKKSRDFHSILGLQELKEAVNDELGESNQLTRLVVDLKGVNPDDAFSTVPYEKGSLFLRYLEDMLGGPEVFDDFLRSYLNKFSKKSLDTDEFKAYLLSYFKNNDKLQTVDWNAWFYTSGMPPVIPEYDTSMTKSVNDLIERISTNATFSYEDISGFTPHQMINFLQSLVDRPALNLETLRNLGEAYRLEASKNAEIKFRWLRLCVRSRDQSKLTEVFQFLNSQGRMKYVRPVYRDLYAWEDVRDQAIDNFLKNEKYMMHVSAYTVRKDLHLDD